MKQIQLFFLLTVGLFSFATPSFAATRYVLNMGDKLFSGQNSVIHLRQALNSQYPQVQLNRSDLVRVRLVAKSRRGGGEASLIVGGNEVTRAGVDGTPRDFNTDLPRTFSRINLKNVGNSNGVWQLRLRGNIKVRRVVVVIDEQRGVPQGRLQVIGEAAANKFISDQDTFNGQGMTGSFIVIQGTDEEVEIQSVTIEYMNGQKVNLHTLNGELEEGERARANLPRQGRIRYVYVTAISPNLFGSRGNYQVAIGHL